MERLSQLLIALLLGAALFASAHAQPARSTSPGQPAMNAAALAASLHGASLEPAAQATIPGAIEEPGASGPGSHGTKASPGRDSALQQGQRDRGPSRPTALPARVLPLMSWFEIWVCKGPSCAGKRDADSVYASLCAEVEAHALTARVRVGRRGCYGRCWHGPNVYVRALRPLRPGSAAERSMAGEAPGGRSALYNRVAPADAAAIVTQHVMGGHILHHLIDPPEDPPAAHLDGEGEAEDPRLATVVLPPRLDSSTQKD